VPPQPFQPPSRASGLAADASCADPMPTRYRGVGITFDHMHMGTPPPGRDESLAGLLRLDLPTDPGPVTVSVPSHPGRAGDCRRRMIASMRTSA
jgi:hypothetical protein